MRICIEIRIRMIKVRPKSVFDQVSVCVCTTVYMLLLLVFGAFHWSVHLRSVLDWSLTHADIKRCLYVWLTTYHSVPGRSLSSTTDARQSVAHLIDHHQSLYYAFSLNFWCCFLSLLCQLSIITLHWDRVLSLGINYPFFFLLLLPSTLFLATKNWT